MKKKEPCSVCGFEFCRCKNLYARTNKTFRKTFDELWEEVWSATAFITAISLPFVIGYLVLMFD